MKYFIAIILLILFFAYGQVMKMEFPFVINLTLIILGFLIAFSWEYSKLNKNFEADIKFRRQKKAAFTYSLILPVYSTILISLNESYNNLIYFALLLWAFPFAELLISFFYRSKKPFTIFIKENELILNNRWTQKRNLTELTQIQFDRFSKNLKLDFKSKPEISIKTTEYKVDDIQKLMEILIEKSENNVFVPQNYEPKIKGNLKTETEVR